MSDQFVYFIQADEDGPIKIGFTTGKPERRLSQLQTGHPAALKLLGAVRGGTARERQFHSAFAEWRLQGEWFEPHPTVVAGIQEALSAVEPDHSGHLHCSFCQTCQQYTNLLIAGPDDLFICDQCVGICIKIVAEQFDKKAEAVLAGPLVPEMGFGG